MPLPFRVLARAYCSLLASASRGFFTVMSTQLATNLQWQRVDRR
jgi:hypothetical protein